MPIFVLVLYFSILPINMVLADWASWWSVSDTKQRPSSTTSSSSLPNTTLLFDSSNNIYSPFDFKCVEVLNVDEEEEADEIISPSTTTLQSIPEDSINKSEFAEFLQQKQQAETVALADMFLHQSPKADMLMNELEVIEEELNYLFLDYLYDMNKLELLDEMVEEEEEEVYQEVPVNLQSAHLLLINEPVFFKDNEPSYLYSPSITASLYEEMAYQGVQGRVDMDSLGRYMEYYYYPVEPHRSRGRFHGVNRFQHRYGRTARASPQYHANINRHAYDHDVLIGNEEIDLDYNTGELHRIGRRGLDRSASYYITRSN